MASVTVDRERSGEIEIGGIGFVERVAPEHHRSFEAIHAAPGRTNMSMAPTLRGWLGSTNGVSRDALGIGRVVRVTPNTMSVQLLAADSDEETAALRSLGWEVSYTGRSRIEIAPVE